MEPSIGRWLTLGAGTAVAFVCFRVVDPGGRNLWLRGAICVLAAALFVLLYREDLAEFLTRARRVTFKKSNP